MLALATVAMAASAEKPVVLTVADLFENKITQYVGKTFVLKTRLQWAYASVKVPEDPTPQEQLEQQAGPLQVPLEGAPFEKQKPPKPITVVGDKLQKVADKEGKQIYSIDGVAFDNHATEYVLNVRLKLREHFKPEMLENPAFVKQSNDPRYWAQTFQLEILGLATPENSTTPAAAPKP
jgi:hypothetical protein